MFHASQQLLAGGAVSVTGTEVRTVVAAFLVGIAVGITGMGGGALMTPALIFLGVGNASAVVTADLTASAVSRSAGAAMHWRHGSPNFQLAGWLILGSVPMAFIGPALLDWVSGGRDLELLLQECIGFALLFAASAYAFRLFLQLRRSVRNKKQRRPEPVIRPVPTVLVGGFGGLLVGITSVGAGSVIMIALLMLYPTLSPVRLVGTDLVQAVPLVLSAAVANILVHGLDWQITIPLVIGSVPGTILGSRFAAQVPQSVIRRAIVVILAISGLALLDKSGWSPLGKDATHPVFIAIAGLALLALVPLIWGGLRRTQGLPMFGKPSVKDIEESQGPQAAGKVTEPVD
jgi:uncharacterized protein